MSAVPWSESQLGELQDLATSGYSASEIAKIVSKKWDRKVSRCAVIGQCSRRGFVLGMKGRPTVPKAKMQMAMNFVRVRLGLSDFAARVPAYYAVRQAYPETSVDPVVRFFGFRSVNAARIAIDTARQMPWWSELVVDETVGLLVADQYGERAA